jgi:hypothetical protein
MYDADTYSTHVVVVVRIHRAQVFTLRNAVHSFALASNGVTYAWGQNESRQLML